MSQYKREDIPPAPLHGVEELQGQLDRFSTSAALRRAEQERDAAQATIRALIDGVEKIATERDQARFDLGRETAERDLARAELASARQELDAVRTARDNLGRELAEARATIRALTRTGGTA